jgi:hypothetical protein
MVLPGLVSALLTMIITFLLWRIARTLREGDPFAPGNARRILIITVCVAGYGLLVEPARVLATRLLLADTPERNLVDVGWSINFQPIGFALLLAALVTIFRRGVRLSEDVKGLV